MLPMAKGAQTPTARLGQPSRKFGCCGACISTDTGWGGGNQAFEVRRGAAQRCSTVFNLASSSSSGWLQPQTSAGLRLQRGGKLGERGQSEGAWSKGGVVTEGVVIVGVAKRGAGTALCHWEGFPRLRGSPPAGCGGSAAVGAEPCGAMTSRR